MLIFIFTSILLISSPFIYLITKPHKHKFHKTSSNEKQIQKRQHNRHKDFED